MCGVLPGCTEEQQPPAQSPRAEGEVLTGSIYIRSSNEAGPAKLATTLASALTQAGYRVVSSADTEHALVAELRVTLRETKGILQVYVNGQPKKSYVAQATLQVTGGGALLGADDIEYDLSDGASEEQVRQLVATATSPAVQRYLAQHQRAQKDSVARREQQEDDAASAKEEQQLAARKEQRRQEEATWRQVVLSECSAATQLTGCDHVKQYLSDYPTGRHAAEAKKALEDAMPLIAKLADERDWRVAKPETCAVPRASTDCDGVASYLSAQPAGVHVDEARALLAKAEPKLAVARKAEGQRNKDEEAKADREAQKADQAEKRRDREQCKKETCLGGMCFNVRPGAFEICMDRCVKANCE
ncbi:MAG TPA: hypothetical protein VNG33_22375 [Polyangiaceae bacterium]|nr:hypothetical protein [Polyangiaceae bacterium]